MNTICCNNFKISINYNNGISYQSHYLSVSFPRNLRALALKCQNIPQKLQVRNCFSQNKKRFLKKNSSFAVKNGLYDYRCPFLCGWHLLAQDSFFPFFENFLICFDLFKRKNTLFSKNSCRKTDDYFFWKFFWTLPLVVESKKWPTANGSMSPRIWFPNVDYLKVWEKGETRLNSIIIIIIKGNRNIKVIFMEEHILIRPDRSLLLLNCLYGMWSSWK